MTLPKVAICIPSGDHVNADFAMALSAMAYGCGRFVHEGTVHDAVPLAIINAKGSLVVNNRNRLVKEAQALGVDYILFLDSDMVIPPGALRRMLSHDKDIVGGTYIQREEPHQLLGKDVDGKPLGESISGTAINTESLTEVGALPTGCLLVKLSVFDKMKKPYFRTPAIESDVDGEEWIQGEDYYFCQQAKALGYSMFVDWGVSANINHLGQSSNKIPFNESK
jgi:glycosyltransferase involved in cell wall biosynthesis